MPSSASRACPRAVTVTASATLIDKESASIKSGLSNEQISGLPVAQEYRDLIRLIPAVQYTQDQTRGPSAGGSGQDNVYQFDGVNVTLPLFGTLSAEPASHDVAQITVIKGGARAVDFDRSGGFSIDSVSKSGTSRYAGQVSYQFQTENMAADLTSGAQSRYKADRSWLDVNVGGPILKDRLFFYGSYYRPENDAEQAREPVRPAAAVREHPQRRVRQADVHADAFGADQRQLPRFEARRHEPADFASNAAGTTGSGSENRQKIGTVEASWVINNRSFATAKFTDFTLLTHGRPDNVANVTISTAPGTRLDLANLDKLGSADSAAADRGADGVTTTSSSRSSTATATAQRTCRPAAASPATAARCSTTTISSARRASRLQPDARQRGAPHDPRGLPALRRLGRSRARSRTAGDAHRAGRARQLPGAAILLPGAGSAAGRAWRPSDSLRIPVAEHRGQRHDRGRPTGRSTRRCWPATTPSTARA